MITSCLAISLMVGTSTNGMPEVEADPPAGPSSFALELEPDGDGVLATWIEPTAGGGGSIRSSRLSFEDSMPTWSRPSTVATGTNLFLNWADRPKVRRAADGSLLAHHLRKISKDTYAYGVRLGRSTDGGTSWQDLGWLHDDQRAVEHGFVSMIVGPRGTTAAWLDGRQMTEQKAGDDHGHGHGSGSMSLRSTVIPSDPDGIPVSTGLDARVCECCDTDMAMTSKGPILVYRDRGPNEERDISIVRWIDGAWSSPAPVHRDGWIIDGCPVNGPSVATSRDAVTVAWFTAAPGVAEDPAAPRVLVASSTDEGATFGPPKVLSSTTIGRTDLVSLSDGGFVACWVDTRESSPVGMPADRDPETGSIALARISAEGTIGPTDLLAPIDLGRRSGFPRMAVIPANEVDGSPARILVAWRSEADDRIIATLIDPAD